MTDTNIEGTEGVVIHEHFDVSRDALWATITDPEELRAWLGPGCSIEPSVGGRVRLAFPDERLTGAGDVRQWAPPDRARALAGFTHTFVDDDEPDRLYDCSWWLIPSETGGCDLRFSLQAVDGSDPDPAPWEHLASAIGSPPPVRETTAVATAEAWLRDAERVLLISWVTKDIPRSLLEAGRSVVAKNGPGADDYATASLVDGDVVFTPTATPAHADLLHLDWTIGFDEYLGLARSIGVRTFWYHSGTTKPPAPADVSGCWVPARKSARLRAAVEGAGMRYVDDRYIVDVAGRIRAT